ncbi:transposase mutator type, partial [Actinobacteria bacterium OV450]
MRQRLLPGRSPASGPSAGAAGSVAVTVTTQAGDLELAIPKLRAGSFFPSLLERRRRIDQA